MHVSAFIQYDSLMHIISKMKKILCIYLFSYVVFINIS